jgi:osmoprotectant transport system permease protein
VTVLFGAEPLVRWGWVVDHLDDVWARTIEHVRLAGIAVAVGFLISLVLAAIALRYRRAYAPISWVAGVLYTIPSAALLGLLLPYTGLGLLTAEIALVSYTLVILVRHIVAGVNGVPAPVREAAVGMGYTPFKRLIRVELPLAVPTIIAGLRVASVSTIGLVTVMSLIGQGGYGTFILDGLRRQFPTPTILGIVLSVALAVVADVTFVAAERLLTPWARANRLRGAR